VNPKAIWAVLEETFDTLGSYGFPAMARAAAELNLESGWFTWIAATWLFGSEPITTAAFMRMLPYGLARLNEERFASAVRQGYLLSDGENGYIPTAAGLRAAHKVWREAGDALMRLPMPEAHQNPLFDYLARLGDASLSAPEPPPHFFIAHKRENYQRFEVVHPPERFVVLFGELAAYRDDAHMAAWLAYNIEGNRWELLTTIWRGEINTLDKLSGELSSRGITRDEYAHFLQELAERGWVDEDSGAYQLTAEGKRLRESAEALTDRYFFAPWSCLNESELEELASLASQLRDGLENPIKKGE
jgi:hypothetical protein